MSAPLLRLRTLYRFLKRSYIESFALVFAAMGEFRDSEYLTALAKLFGCEDSVECVKNVSAALRANPRSVNEQVRGDLSVMNDDRRRYSWALDAYMLGCVDGAVHEKVKSGVKTVMSKAFRLQMSAVEDFLLGVEALVTERDISAIKDVVGNVSGKTPNWASIARFRGLEIAGDVGDKSVSVSSSGDVEVVGLHLEKSKKVPFLANDVERMVAFKGCWYVVESSNFRTWKSADGFTWKQVELPITEGGGCRFTETDDCLVFWCDFGKQYCYTTDGEKWIAAEFEGDLANIQHAALTYIKEKGWMLHAYESESFTYEDGLIFKTTETGYYDKSVLYFAEELGGEWEKHDDELSFMETGHHVVKGFPFYVNTEKVFSLLLTEMDGSYRFDHKYENCYVKFYYADDSTEDYQGASSDGEISLPTFPRYYEVVEIDGGVVFHGCDNGVYYSQAGRSWRKVFDKTLCSKMSKVGKYYCSFVESFGWRSEPGELVITSDGIDFKTIKIEQKPCKVCFNADKVFLIDENEENGGMFVGKVEIEQA